VTPDARNDSKTASEPEGSPHQESARESSEPVMLPDSHRAHHGPTPLAAPTQHKTIETATVKIKEEETEERRRVTLRLRKSDLPKVTAASEPDDAVSPQDEITAPDHHALEIQLALRRVTTPTRHWLLLGGAAGLVAVVVIFLLVRSGTSTPAPIVSSAPRAATAAMLPPAPRPVVPEPARAAEPDPIPIAALTPEPEAKPRATKPAPPEQIAAPRRVPATAPTANEPQKSTTPPKAAFPPAEQPADIRRDVPF
jgi:hypothetical protein